MINLREKTIELRGQTGDIECFETWWITPKGMIADLDEALNIAKAMGYPDEVLRPVTVAICKSGLYEAMT